MVDSDIRKQVMFDIDTLVNAGQPSSIVVVGLDDAAFLEDYLAQKTALGADCRVHRFGIHDALSKLDGRYDLGIVMNALEYLAKDKARQLMASLRDVHARRFIVVVPIGPQQPDHASAWQAADLLGFGMSLVNRYQAEGRNLHMYKYDMASYKKVPEWLNASGWANPERWDKYRW